MTEMQISEYYHSYDHASNFDFPNNPSGIVPLILTKKALVPIDYRSILPFINYGTIKPGTITLTGNFNGANRDTNMRAFAKRLFIKDLRKFWISDTKFIYFIGGSLRPSLLGGKNNFVDYVATLISPIAFWYNGTAKIYTVTTVGATALTLNDATANSTGAFINSGGAPGHIHHIAVTRTNGTITGFNFGDKAISSSAVDGDNIINWTGTSVGANEILHIYLLHHVGHKCDKWYYFKTGHPSESQYYGTTDSGTATTLTDAAQSGDWAINEWANYVVYIGGGTGIGQMRRIVSNTTTVLTVEKAWDTNPSSDSTYTIGNDATTYGTRNMTGDNLEDGPRVKDGETDQAFSAQITGTSTPQGTIRVTWYEADWVK